MLLQQLMGEDGADGDGIGWTIYAVDLVGEVVAARRQGEDEWYLRRRLDAAAQQLAESLALLMATM
jgi:hypothetical protein